MIRFGVDMNNTNDRHKHEGKSIEITKCYDVWMTHNMSNGS